MKHTFIKCFASCMIGMTLFSNIYPQTAFIAHAEVDYQAEMEARKLLPIDSDSYQNWPQGPAVGAESAIVMEANTHTILYEKNIHKEMYPASTTKILTCLLAAEASNMSDTVTFSREAVYTVPSDGSSMGMDAGESITMEQALYGVLVGSANEAANAVAEHISGSLSSFAELMNKRAKELGCENSHFVNSNGLFDENHYTSAYDLALIGCEFFSHDNLCRMSSTANYNIPPTANQPDDIWVNSKNRLLKGKTYDYPYLVGSKTGFVSQSRQTLVSCAEKDGMKLICVVFMEETPYQFSDTVTLFNYGFDNFTLFNIAANETQYAMSDHNDFFSAGQDVFGDSSSLMEIDPDASIILPNNAVFHDADSSLSYHESDMENVIATIDYTYYGQKIGSADIVFSNKQSASYDFDTPSDFTIMEKNSSDGLAKTIFVNITTIILYIIIGAAVVILLIFLYTFLKSYHFSPKGRSRKRRVQRSKQIRLVRKNKRHSSLSKSSPWNQIKKTRRRK